MKEYEHLFSLLLGTEGHRGVDVLLKDKKDRKKFWLRMAEAVRAESPVVFREFLESIGLREKKVGEILAYRINFKELFEKKGRRNTAAESREFMKLLESLGLEIPKEKRDS